MPYKKLRLIVFDVDGTLYDQRALRLRMFRALMGYYLMHPLRIYDLKILYHFRKEREKRGGAVSFNLNDEQYAWAAKAANADAGRVQKVVEKWMFSEPLKYLKHHAFPEAVALIKFLRTKEIRTAVFSDYDAKYKLSAMGITVDLAVAATDPHINRLKPDPEGLIYIQNYFNTHTDECLFIGDRYDRDVVCAERAGVNHYLVQGTATDKRKHFLYLREQLSL